MMNDSTGKLSKKDAALARVLKVAPWFAILVSTLPAPLLFLVLFLMTEATDSAAVYLLLAGVSFGFGLVIGLIIAAVILFYRRYWLVKLRDRLALDGITAGEVSWFTAEADQEDSRPPRLLSSSKRSARGHLSAP